LLEKIVTGEWGVENEYGQWEAQGHVIAKTDHANRWALADWLAVGEKWHTRNTYHFAQRIFPEYSRKYLQELAYVARSVNLPVRQESLSFTHHQLVTAMEPADQIRWLIWAVEQKASVSTLRLAISAERRTEDPFAVPLPKDLLEQVNLLAAATGLSAEALVIKALTALVAQSAEDIKKEVEAAVARELAREAAARTRNEKLRLLEKALRVANKEWQGKATAQQDVYVRDNMPEDVAQLREATLGACRDAKDAFEAARLASDGAPADEALQEATRQADEALRNARTAYRDAEGPYQELQRHLVAEAKEKFPATPPIGLLHRAEIARHAANIAAYELRELMEATPVKTRVAAEAEQVALEAESAITPEALAAEAEQLSRGPQVLVQTTMFEQVRETA
jgi:hypothetical protein